MYTSKAKAQRAYQAALASGSIKKAEINTLDPIVLNARSLPILRRSIRAALGRLRDDVDLPGLVDALNRRDASLAAVAVGLDSMEDRLRQYMSDFFAEIRVVARRASILAERQVPHELVQKQREREVTAAIRLRFGAADPEGARLVAQILYPLIQGITAEQRAMIIEIIERAFMEGGNSNHWARVIRDIVGLTERQATWVENFRTQLEQRTNSPDGRTLTPVTGRRLTQTDKRRAAQHLLAGALPRADMEALIDRYHEKLVDYRAQVIARTEIARANTHAQQETWEQAAQAGYLDTDKARKVWSYTQDERVRHSHVQIRTMNPDGVPLNGMFQTPMGYPIAGPPAEPNCRCAIVLSPTGKRLAR